MTFFISDTHFGDEISIQIDHRPFQNIEEMDKNILKNWNEKVKPEDDVYIVGDLLCHNKNHDAKYYLRQLTGHLHLIIGNHDHTFLEDKSNEAFFDSINDIKTIYLDGKEIVLSHFPLAEWNGCFRGTYQIYGHIHNSRHASYDFMKTQEKAYNCGCMICDYQPVTFDELVEFNKIYKK